MTLYLITQGTYSDRVVVALLSDAEQASRLATHLEAGEMIPVPLDVYAPQLRLGLLPYRVWIDPHATKDRTDPFLGDVRDPEHYSSVLGPTIWEDSAEAARRLARQRKSEEP